MKASLLLSFLFLANSAHAENDGAKLVAIQCLPALGKLNVKAIDSATVGLTPQKIHALREQGVYVGIDFGTEKGYTVDQTCVLGNAKLRVVVSYGNNFGNGYCGADPGARIELYRNGEKLKALQDKYGSDESFDEDCRMGLSSVTEVGFDALGLLNGKEQSTLTITHRTNSVDDKPDAYETKTISAE